MGENKELSIYIHIPFCFSKCNYCSFNSFPIGNFNSQIVDEYFESLLREIQLYSYILNNSEIKTIYFGGGTPSIVDVKYIEKILKYLLNFKTNNIEITIEANPLTIKSEKLKQYKESDINRISLGVQSFNNEILKFLGRPYTSGDAILTIEAIKKIFDNFSIDLIFAVPGQNIKDLYNDLRFLEKYKIPHISIYGLSIESGSTFFKQGINEIDEEIYAEMYAFICDTLKKYGYIQYEISNFSYIGYESKHNLGYWNFKPYLGFGAGAHSFYANKRWSNVSSVYEYIKIIKEDRGAIEFVETISETKMQNEFIFLNLRKKAGLNINDFKKKFGVDFRELFRKKLNDFKKEGFIIIDDSCVRLTEKGFLVSDFIFTEFFINDIKNI